jgi:outer membrane protein TolC
MTASNFRPSRLAVALLAGSIAGCTVGPDYHRPAAISAARLKEMPPPPGWAYADPHYAELPKGAWWTVYNDPILNRLEERVNVSNLTIKQDEAAFRQARALVDEARSALFPVATLTPSITRTGSGGGATQISSASTATTGTFATGGGGGEFHTTSYQLAGNIDWTLDVWGGIRRQVESQVDYFSLRYQDSLQTLLDQFIAYYEQSAQITRNEYNAGIIAPTDLLQAETQVATTKAQSVQVGIARAQYEHAIAVLAGLPPADLSIAPAALTGDIPAIPVTIPSLILQRRPDIAEAERAMAEQNAQIGVAIAAFYPTISLSAVGSYAGNPIGSLFDLANRSWSIAATAAETLFDGGERTATVRAARALFDQSIANYRLVVLTAFQQIEDLLSGLRILAIQADAQARAVDLSNQAVTVSLNQYRAGTAIYTTVITNQATALSNAEVALGIQESRVLDSVQLITALGGGWNRSNVFDKNRLQSDNPLLPAFISPDRN